jgi:O-antigen/teichoic acid export membrane protein
LQAAEPTLSMSRTVPATSVKSRSARASVLLSAFDAVAFTCSFARNMILARMLTTTDFGIAATLAMIISLLEFASKTGVGQCVVQDKHGGDADFVASAHLFQFLVAIVSALIMVGAAAPLAQVLGIGQYAWAAVMLALIPLLRGVEHMDMRRFERHLRFLPSSLTELIPQVAVTLAAWPVATWLRDYRSIVVLLVAKATIGCACTHLVAERPYRWKIDGFYLGRLLTFGWPLVATGFIMFAVMQGEQFTIATFYRMSDVAPYAAANSLALLPVFFFGRIFGSVLLPLLAAVQDDRAAFQRRYRQVLGALACVAAATSVGLIVGGEAVINLVYGAKYRGAGVLLAILAAAGALRTIRAATALAAMARGDARNELYSNGTRLAGLIPVLILAARGDTILRIACCAVFGEALACCACIVRLQRRDGVRAGATLLPAASVAVMIACAFLLVFAGAHRLTLVAGIAAAAVAALVAALAVAAVLPEVRSELTMARGYLRSTTPRLSASYLPAASRALSWGNVLALFRSRD